MDPSYLAGWFAGRIAIYILVALGAGIGFGAAMAVLAVVHYR